MARYETFGPDAEVLGSAMLAFVESMNYGNLMVILEQHNLTTIEPDRWYPQQIWLDVFSDVASTEDLVSVGMKIVNTAKMPPELETLPFIEIMSNFNQGSYLANNRGADIGEIAIEVVDDNHIIMIDKTPYPDSFVYGAYYAMARKYLPKNYQFTIRYDSKVKRRSEGGTETRVHIEWK